MRMWLIQANSFIGNIRPITIFPLISSKSCSSNDILQWPMGVFYSWRMVSLLSRIHLMPLFKWPQDFFSVSCGMVSTFTSWIKPPYLANGEDFLVIQFPRDCWIFRCHVFYEIWGGYHYLFWDFWRLCCHLLSLSVHGCLNLYTQEVIIQKLEILWHCSKPCTTCPLLPYFACLNYCRC